MSDGLIEIIVIVLAVAFLILFNWLRYKRFIKKVHSFLREKGFTVLKTEIQPVFFFSRGSSDICTAVIDRGDHISCCRVEASGSHEMIWSVLEEREYCRSCGQIYNSCEYTSCPDCFS